MISVSDSPEAHKRSIWSNFEAMTEQRIKISLPLGKCYHGSTVLGLPKRQRGNIRHLQCFLMAAQQRMQAGFSCYIKTELDVILNVGKASFWIKPLMQSTLMVPIEIIRHCFIFLSYSNIIFFSYSPLETGWYSFFRALKFFFLFNFHYILLFNYRFSSSLTQWVSAVFQIFVSHYQPPWFLLFS